MTDRTAIPLLPNRREYENTKTKMTAIQRTLIVMAAIFTVVTSDYYKAMTSSGNGSTALCATNAPTVRAKIDLGSSLRCATKCDRFPCCVAYQFDKDMSQCQLYNYTPTAFVEKRNCKAFAVNEDVRQSVSAERDCSFPFTYNGRLYYSCVVDSTIPCNGWCFLPKRVAKSCSYPTYGYVARSVAVSNFTTPNNTILGTLMSVGGWLTICYRTYNDWPSGLGYAEYAKGFNNLPYYVWIGLERLYWLTNAAVNGGKSYQMRFEMKLLSNESWYSIEYDWFYVDNAASNYVSHASMTSYGDIVDAFNDPSSPSNGRKFAYGGSCSTTNNGRGWWYDNDANYSCSKLRFFGKNSDFGFSVDEVGPLSEARMMVK